MFFYRKHSTQPLPSNSLLSGWEASMTIGQVLKGHLGSQLKTLPSPLVV